MKKQWFVSLWLWGALLSCQAATLKVPYTSETGESYEFGLLKLALSYSQEHDEFVQAKEKLNDETSVAEVDKGNLDLFWTATNRELESRLLPIRIPLFKGLFGHRIFAIRRGEQATFDAVHSLADLARLKAGQGRFWSDTRILQAAGLPVVTAVKIDSFYPMLEGGRFDYYPRGAGEIWSEIAARPDQDLVAEERLLLVYKMPLYFFTAKHRTELAQRIQDGLEQAIADGSFDRYFYGHATIQSILRQANLHQRRVLSLENPDLPAQTPLMRTELWFDSSKR